MTRHFDRVDGKPREQRRELSGAQATSIPTARHRRLCSPFMMAVCRCLGCLAIFMARRRSSVSSARGASDPSPVIVVSRPDFWWIATAVCGITAAVWAVLLLGQPIALGWSRWMLFFNPTDLVSGWIDGPVGAVFFGQRLSVVAVAAVVMTPAYAAGRWLVGGYSAVSRLCPAERFAAAAAGGLGIQSTVLLGCGLAGILNSAWMWAIWPVGVMVIAVVLRRLIVGGDSIPAGGIAVASKSDAAASTGRDSASGETQSGSLALLLPTGLFVVFATLLILRSIVPPSEFDVREYHLQAPKEWWAAGKIDFMPHNIYANMPMAAEIHTVAAMKVWRIFADNRDAWWWGMLSGKVVIASFLVWMAILVGGVVRCVVEWSPIGNGESDGDGNGDTRWLVAWTRVIAIGFPALFEGASVGFVEPAMACFAAWGMMLATVSVAGATAGANGVSDAAGRSGAAIRLAAAIGLAIGFAMACKYPAVLSVAPVMVIYGLWVWGRFAGYPLSDLVGRRVLVVAIMMALAGGSSWYIKNAMIAGNPVYPLLGQWLGGKTLSPEKVAQWNAGHAVPGYQISQLVASFGDTLWRWRSQGWALVPLAITAVVASRRRDNVSVGVICLAVVFVLWWGLTHRVERFLVPVLPVAIVMAALGIETLRRTAGRGIATTMVVPLVLMNLYFVASPAVGDSRIAVDLNYLRDDDLSASSISRLGGHVIWANRTLGPDDRLLVVGDAEVLDFEVSIAYATAFDQSPLMGLLATEGSPGRDDLAALGDELRRSGFTHVVVHWGEIIRLRQTYGFDPRITPQLFSDLADAEVLIPLETGLDPSLVQAFAVGGGGE